MKLDNFCLLANHTRAGETLCAEWSARAGDISGVVRGTVDIAVDPRVPTIGELLVTDSRAKPDDREGRRQG